MVYVIGHMWETRFVNGVIGVYIFLNIGWVYTLTVFSKETRLIPKMK